MTAWSKNRARRRRRNAVVLAIVGLLAAAFGPAIAASAVSAVDRHVNAEARGDTAQGIANKIRNAISINMERPAALVMAPNGTGKCEVHPLYIEVDCNAVIKYRTRADAAESYVVVVKRHGEKFKWDSKKVAAVAR